MGSVRKGFFSLTKKEGAFSNSDRKKIGKGNSECPRYLLEGLLLLQNIYLYRRCQFVAFHFIWINTCQLYANLQLTAIMQSLQKVH